MQSDIWQVYSQTVEKCWVLLWTSVSNSQYHTPCLTLRFIGFANTSWRKLPLPYLRFNIIPSPTVISYYILFISFYSILNYFYFSNVWLLVDLMSYKIHHRSIFQVTLSAVLGVYFEAKLYVLKETV